MLLYMHNNTSVVDLHKEQLVGTEELLPSIIPVCCTYLQRDSTLYTIIISHCAVDADVSNRAPP